MEKSNDGFYLAEVDLTLRGPGEIYGRAQHRALNLQIATLADRLRRHASFSFSSFMEHAKDKGEMVVSFLALLELVKQRVVKVAQADLFHDIDIAAHDLDRLADIQPEFV